MPRYEFSEGSSNKFWEIALEGTSFTTTYGRLGTDGQMSLKEYDSEAKAQKEYDKLVAEKVKKGYALVDGNSGAAPARKAAAPVAVAAPAPKAAARVAAPAKKSGAVFEDEGDDEDETPKKKPAPAAAAPAAAAPKPAPSSGSSKSGDAGARYFEFVEGSSSKFWEIALEGNSFTTRYGKIGTDGQQSLKEYASDALAKKEYDKLVAEKSKKGYLEK